MSNGYYFNENLTYNIEVCDLKSEQLIVQGWLFAHIPVTELALVINGDEKKASKVATYGLNSADVEQHFGSIAACSRFAEKVDVSGLDLKEIVLRIKFSNGAMARTTIKAIPSASQPASTSRSNSREVRLGIGITTFKRRTSLEKLLDRIRHHTRLPYDLVVADDGSQDDTLELLRSMQIPFVTGNNRGIAWNKNRALYYLNSRRASDVVILLEDDTYPSVDGWEETWIGGALRYGHVNLAGHWFQDMFVTGRGTVDDPIISRASSGQCVSFSRRALETVGYFDPRFGRYGYEHIEHTERCIRAGFGGVTNYNGSEGTVFFLVRGGVTVSHMLDFHFASLIPENAVIYHQVRQDEIHRWAWRGDEQMNIFLEEQRNAEFTSDQPKYIFEDQPSLE